jgi:hypothetical protein
MLRYNRCKWQLIFLLVVVAKAGSLSAQGISLRIETETGVTQFRIGEAIGLKLTFESSSPDVPVPVLDGQGLVDRHFQAVRTKRVNV